MSAPKDATAMPRHPAQVQRFAVILDLPPRGVSPNGREHWSKRARAVRIARSSARFLFRTVKPEGWVQRPVSLEVHYHAPYGSIGYRPRDTQNAIAALKSAIDGMVDAGIVPDDSSKWVSWGAVRLTRNGDELAPGVYVTVVAEAAARLEEPIDCGDSHGRTLE